MNNTRVTVQHVVVCHENEHLEICQMLAWYHWQIALF